VPTALPTLTTLIFFSWLDSPSGPGLPPGCGFEITLRHATLDETPLEEWSNTRRDLNVTIHNVYNRGIMFQAGFEPAIPASEGPQTHALGRAATRMILSHQYLWT